MLTQRDLPNLIAVLDDDFQADKANRQSWEIAFRIYTRMYDGVVSSKSFPFENASNLNIPVIGWTVDALHASLQNPLFATDEIFHVKPRPEAWTGTTEKAKAVGQFINWQFSEPLDFFNVIDEVTPRMILYGTWFVKFRPERKVIMTAQGPEKVYEGPALCSVSPWDVFLPGDCGRLDDAEHITHRLWRTPSDLLIKEKQGIYEKIEENWERLQAGLRYKEELEDLSRDTRIVTEAGMGRRNYLEVLESYYQADFDGDGIAEEWILTWLKETRLLIRAVPLLEVFPSGRRPWVQFIYKHAMRGPYGKGIGQELEDLNQEVNAVFNQLTDSGTLTLAPPTAVRAGTPMAAQLKRDQGLSPGMVYETEDPQRDIHMLQFTPNLAFGVQDVQFLLGIAERITGVSDLRLGRTSQQPGNPRTYGQQLMMQENQKENVELVAQRYKRSLSKCAEQTWWLDKAYLPPLTFFRVTAADGTDLLKVMSPEDLRGNYDFSVQAISPARNKMVERTQKMQALQFILPLLDRARVDPGVFRLVKLVWETFDLQRLEEIIILGEDAVTIEHAAMLKGERVTVTPVDDHQRHMGLHYKFAQEAQAEGREDVAMVAQSHIAEHAQVAQKSRGVQAGKAQGAGAMGSGQMGSGGGSEPLQAMGPQLLQMGQFQPGNKSGSRE